MHRAPGGKRSLGNDDMGFAPSPFGFPAEHSPFAVSRAEWAVGSQKARQAQANQTHPETEEPLVLRKLAKSNDLPKKKRKKRNKHTHKKNKNKKKSKKKQAQRKRKMVKGTVRENKKGNEANKQAQSTTTLADSAMGSALKERVMGNRPPANRTIGRKRKRPHGNQELPENNKKSKLYPGR